MLAIPEDKLRELLIKDGVVKEEEFSAAVEEARRMGQNPADILIAKNLITPDYYLNLTADFYKVERAGLVGRALDEAIVQLAPESVARERRVIVFGKNSDGSYAAALENPVDLETIDYLTKLLQAAIVPYLASAEDLHYGFSFYSRRSAAEFKKIIEENIAASRRTKAAGLEQAAEEVPIVAIVDNLIAYAIASRASDIHLEILEKELMARYRIDGILQEITRIPKEVHPAVVARIKLLASLKLDEHAKPQDGRFRYKLGQDLMDIRVAIMPTFYGEKVEMRLLAATQRPQSLEELGMLEDHVALVRENIKKTFGMILVTGPTGSGKTTTLYSIMNILNRPEVNIVTVEDPIEYDMKYINQTQVNPAQGISFASGLREIVRQDPNIIMVGEIRDQETAGIAVQSALTGHLVLSTLHTNDAATAVPRLLDMKVPAFLVAAVINLLQAQRLVRRICLSCIVSYQPEAAVEEMVRRQLIELKIDKPYQAPRFFYRGQGCPSCSQSGYKGRLGIFEMLPVTEEVRQAIVSPDFSLDQLQDLARKQGMITIFEDGLRKVERGMTTIEEVLRVIRE